jgi:hypothetical protein
MGECGGCLCRCSIDIRFREDPARNQPIANELPKGVADAAVLRFCETLDGGFSGLVWDPYVPVRFTHGDLFNKKAARGAAW